MPAKIKLPDTPARIIGQNHSITPYEVNGRKRYIIEDIPQSANRQIVNDAIEKCGSREWSDVYNYIDEYHDVERQGLAKVIESMTY